MPYTRFAEAARDTRHDLEQLSIQFGASIEQVAHRLSTLQRPGAKGVPFFFARVDQAGTSPSATPPRGCNSPATAAPAPVERAPRLRDAGPLPAPAGRNARRRALRDPRPRRVEIRRGLGHAHPPLRHLSGLRGLHAPQLVYADGLDLDRDASFQPIGISCRICERAHCHQRAVPPLERRLRVNPDHRGTLPYDIAD
jgi:hypothetical protein